MEVKIIKVQKEWDDFLARQKGFVSFTQSWEWGDFKRSVGEVPVRVAVYEKKQPILGGQFLEINIPLINKKRFYCAYGPVGEWQNQKAVKTLLDFLDQYSQELNLFILDFELPMSLENAEKDEFVKHLKNADYFTGPCTIQPRRTAFLDLRCLETELLALCKPKTRYNIRLAERKGVEIRVLNRPDWDIFYKLLKETSKRNRAVFHPRSYFEGMAKSLISASMLTMLEAVYEKQVVASLIIIGFRNTATYLYGASSDFFRNTMANYLLHWKAICWAKQKGYQNYDFWGISDGSPATKNWEGITRFKQGFSGREITYAGMCRKTTCPLFYAVYLVLQVTRKFFLDLFKKF